MSEQGARRIYVMAVIAISPERPCGRCFKIIVRKHLTTANLGESVVHKHVSRFVCVILHCVYDML